MEKSPLLDCHELYLLVDSAATLVIDTRDSETYQKGHISGAVNIPEIFSYLSTAESGGLEALVKDFSETLSNAGITENDYVVIYEDTLNSGYGQSCRGYFILDYLGHKQKAVLQGGYKDWLDAGYPIAWEGAVREKSRYQTHLNPEVIVTLEQMKAALCDESIVKLDCRDAEEWQGLVASPYTPDFDIPKGRIPGAVWLEWTKFIDHQVPVPQFAENEKILALCKQVGITPETTVYVYCFKGSRSSNTMLALKKAGIRNVRNYFGSWNEWSRDTSLPIDDRVLKNHA